jgi:Tfp pilus assembly protein PilN
MELERIRPLVLRGTFHAYELAALVAAARYVVESAPAEIPTEALDQLNHLLTQYDQQVHNLTPHPQQPH